MMMTKKNCLFFEAGPTLDLKCNIQGSYSGDCEGCCCPACDVLPGKKVTTFLESLQDFTSPKTVILLIQKGPRLSTGDLQ
jgi:hypothetical protein